MPTPRAIVPDTGGIRPGVNNTGTTIAKARIVKKHNATSGLQAGVDAVTPAVDGTAICYGVTMQAILDGAAGDVQVQGRALVEMGVAIAIGQNITGGTGGKGAIAGGSVNIIGVAASAGLADGDIVECDLIRTIG